MNCPAALDAGLPNELRGANLHPEMRLAPFAMARMAAMLRTLIDHEKMRRLEGRLQLGLDALLDRIHAATPEKGLLRKT
jgi:hypothetical protein